MICKITLDRYVGLLLSKCLSAWRWSGRPRPS